MGWFGDKLKFGIISKDGSGFFKTVRNNSVREARTKLKEKYPDCRVILYEKNGREIGC